MTKIVHIKDNNYDIYIGRGSIFGNPFRIGVDGNRKQVIEKYKKYFYKRINNDEMFKIAVLKLKDKVLACYCKPLDCHGDVIKEYLETTNA